METTPIALKEFQKGVGLLLKLSAPFTQHPSILLLRSKKEQGFRLLMPISFIAQHPYISSVLVPAVGRLL
jgi:hypothetical protein